MTPVELRDLGYPLSCLDEQRLTVLRACLQATNTLVGEVWECGAYRGGTSLLLKAHLMQLDSPRHLRAFDTFAGMPVSGPFDTHAVGSFAETSLAQVKALLDPLPNVTIHAGQMPATFVGLEDRVISVAHIDVDQYESVSACLTFVYPRLQRGGRVVLDDYNCPGCPGAHRAVEEYMADKVERDELRHTGNTPQVWFEKA